MASITTYRRLLSASALPLRNSVRPLSTSNPLRAEAQSSNPGDHNPSSGPAYTAEGRRHKTDNETQREEAIAGTPEKVDRIVLLVETVMVLTV